MSAQYCSALEFSSYLNTTITHFGYLKNLSLPLSLSLSLTNTRICAKHDERFELKKPHIHAFHCFSTLVIKFWNLQC